MNIRLLPYHAIGFLAVLFVLTSCDSNSSSSEEIVETKEERAAQFFWEGVKHLELKDYKLAINDFDSAIGIDPNLTEAFLGRAYAKDYRFSNNASNVIRDFTLFINAKLPGAGLNGYTLYDGYRGRGWAKFDGGDYSGAVLDADNAIQVNPEGVNAYILGGIANQKLEKYSTSIEYFSSALALQPGNHYSLRNRGFSHLNCAHSNRSNCVTPSVYWGERTKSACQDWRIAADYGDNESLKALVKHCQ